MVGELLCPDCGGVVGATETTEAGIPCKCFAVDPSAKSETAVEMPPLAEVPVEKICRICGKDVSHEKRVKDHSGYYCVPCSKEEDKKDRQGRVRCRVCGKLTKEENILPYEGTKMCHRCRAERAELQKQQIKRLGIKSARTREEWRRIYGLAGALVVLLVIMSYGLFKLVHGH